MAVLVIAGSGRGSGKTAVGCALMAAMPELRWVAVKVSPHGHDVPGGLREQTDRTSEKDTRRYLTAGAVRSFLLSAGTVSADSISEAMSGWLLEARRRAPEADALLVESNRIELESIAAEGEPALCVVVLAEPEVDWKPSLVDRIARTNRLVVVCHFAREETVPQFTQKPTFHLPEGEWMTPELLALVRNRLLAKD